MSWTLNRTGNSASLSSLSSHLSFSQQFLNAAAFRFIARPLEQSFQVLDVFPVNKTPHCLLPNTAVV
jgi:hypothetical protein